MQSNFDNIKKLIIMIGFAPQDGKSGVYCKSYASHGGYSIFVDFNNQTICYDSKEFSSDSVIKVWEKTTSNFSKAENFVVLECVDSLLEKGYAPCCIELEKTYPSGDGRSGRLDILVKTTAGIPFLMIECKTWGAMYQKEKAKMLKSGGQLFAYYTNDRAVKYLCLYTSCIKDGRERQSAIVDVDNAWKSLSGMKEIHGHWNKNFKDNGIFDSYSVPYDIKHKSLTYGELQILREEDSGKIYNQIMEILRHNAISDKPNAFNKLLNLFVCKIIDEDKNPEDELEFQWLESDDDESFQLRLNDLYKEGMWRFLEIDVIDYKQDEVRQKLENIDSDTRKWIMQMYKDTRLKKSPNFAFVEVQDDKTFALNAKVVREIVELLQVYKFRYEQKHEFLGNFFELLLNTSMKQEAGQFFTPVPITRFMILSLPLQELVQRRINEKKSEPLPTVIDYACGSGHFLTEYMSQMQNIIDNKVDINCASPSVRREFLSWQGFRKFLWAKDTVYGIDLDNRLVKTAKVSAFFNGDGEASIIWANGLDHFTKSQSFRGKLAYANGKDNGQFDILISNPPYSVDAFRSTVEYGRESFELYPYLTDRSSEIECLFVERMKQLLKAGGWAAVILPSSILNNMGIYAKAREILLKYFKIKAIMEAGNNTFMKTNANTVILFLERRSDDDCININRAVNQFFATHRDVAAAGIENAFSTYVSSVYEGLEFQDYISMLDGEPREAAKMHKLYADYVKEFGENFQSSMIAIEKEKMLYFLLTFNQNIVLIKTGKGKDEKQFFGYRFSEWRGHEGLHRLSGGTKLYDEAESLNPQKVSSYIYHAFLGEKVEIDESLKDNISYSLMSGLIEYGTSIFVNKINLGKKMENNPKSKYPLVSISEISSVITKGTTPTTLGFEFADTGVNFIKIENITEEGAFCGELAHVSSECNEKLKRSQLKAEDVLFSIAGSFGRIALVPESILPANTNQALAIIRGFKDNILVKYFVGVLRSGFIKPQIEKFAKGIAQYNISLKEVGSILIPLPPLEIQQRIVGELEWAEGEEARLGEQAAEIKMRITALVESCYHRAQSFDKLGNIAHYATERIAAGQLGRDTYVGVDNLIADMGGKRPSDYVPVSGFVTAYHPKNILLSNIRPYLKKAWFADNNGGGSNDVLILQVDTAAALPEYVFLHTSSDRFFEYEMQNIGSNVKMPRANKNKVLDYLVPLLSMEEQQKIAAQVSQYEAEINSLKTRLCELKAEKEMIMKKYL